ncbi:MAG TPA: EAL domain-containing protein [Pseudolysinimonas sp.]|nr:EAL domain-containing protein [Pseudolysinimonas sp.]
MTSEMAGAVHRGEIDTFFQPQIEIATGRTVAVECLSRWRHPERGIVGPDEFIPIAERTGAIHEIGTYMLWRGCRCGADWAARGTAVQIAVNVSALQLGSAAFYDSVFSTLDETSFSPEGLIIEVTESREIADHGATAGMLSVLRDAGIAISIDDFGTGFSSLAVLDLLPATEIKIDRSVVQGAAGDTESELERIVGIGRDRGLRVVAEGVETDDQYDLVRDAGCDRAQGFLFGRPMPEQRIAELLLV